MHQVWEVSRSLHSNSSPSPFLPHCYSVSTEFARFEDFEKFLKHGWKCSEVLKVIWDGGAYKHTLCLVTALLSLGNEFQEHNTLLITARKLSWLQLYLYLSNAFQLIFALTTLCPYWKQYSSKKTTSAPMIRTEEDQPRPGNASKLKQKGVRDGKRLPNTPTGSNIPQYMCSIMVLEALEALHRLITQSNDLTVKCWAGIKEINAQVPALKSSHPWGSHINSCISPPLPTKPPLNYWLQNLSEDARGKDHSKGFLKIIIFLP